MKLAFLLFGIFLQLSVIHCLIVPDELPTLLSVVFSNIPTIKKGTDSRLGWGFRLGNRADFQVLVELGPQLNTQPLANQNSDGNNKRNVANNLRNTLYAQQQLKKQVKKQQSNTEGGKWIEEWKNNFSKNPTQQNVIVNDVGVGEINAKDVIPDDPSLMLQKLLKEQSAPNLNKNVPTTQKPKTTTSYKDALDNVDMEDSR